MSISLDLLCFSVPFTILFYAVLSIYTGVGGCEWTISAMAVLMDVAFWKFSNGLLNSDSVADAMTFIMILYSTCTVPLPGKFLLLVCWILVRGKKIHLI